MQSIDFNKQLPREKPIPFSLQTMLYLIGGLLLILLLAYGFTKWQLSKQQAMLLNMTHKQKEIQRELKLLGKNHPDILKQAQLQSQVDLLASDIKSQEATLAKLSHTKAVSKLSQYLTTFSKETPDGLWLTSFNILPQKNKIQLTGEATEQQLVSLFASRLNQIVPIKNKKIDHLTVIKGKQAKRNLVKFTLANEN